MYLIVLLAVMVIFAYLIGNLLNLQVFDFTNRASLFLIYAVVGSFVYFTIKFQKLFDTIISVVFLAVITGFIYKPTDMMTVFGNLVIFIVYWLVLFIAFAYILKLIWIKFKYSFIRSIVFSIINAFLYMLISIVFHLILGVTIEQGIFMRYILFGLLVFLTTSIGFRIYEFIIKLLEDKFTTPSERIKTPLQKEKEKEKSDTEKETSDN